MKTLWPLLLCLCLTCSLGPSGRRGLELYLARPGEPGLELPDLLPISHPLLLRQTLAGVDTFRQELAGWLNHPRLRLLDTRLLDFPSGRREREWTRGQANGAQWLLQIRRRGERRQVQLCVRESGTERLSGWTDLMPQEDLVLGMPLADGSSLLLRLPPGAPRAAASSSASDSLLDRATYRELSVQPAMVGGPMQLASLIRYPPAALRDGIQGTVLLTLLVDEQGVVRESEVMRGVRADLDSVALAAGRRARFTPAQDAQGAVAAWVTLPVRFQLQ